MARAISIDVPDSGQVGALLEDPRAATSLFVFAHGAGAGMTHPFMDGIARRLAVRAVGTLRFAFPYMHAGRKAPDRAPRLEATVVAALAEARQRARGRMIVAGGKSMGGRMTSRVCARLDCSDVRGLIFVGFPLHAAGKPSTERADHLSAVAAPMLFIQGTRDRLADPDLLRQVTDRLPGATVHMIDDANHSFDVPVRSGRRGDDVLDDIADVMAAWIGGLR